MATMLDRNAILRTKLTLLAGVLAGGLLVLSAGAQTGSQVAGSKPAASAPMHYHPDRFAGRAGKYYALVWGVNSLSVKWTESSEVVCFAHYVGGGEETKTLNDKKDPTDLI